MASNNINNGKRNYSRPTTPATVVVTTSTSTTDTSISITPNTVGPVPASYTISAASTNGGLSTSVTVVTSNTSQPTVYAYPFNGQIPALNNTAGGLNSAKSYILEVTPINSNGTGNLSATTSFTTVGAYELALTANSTQNFTVPAGATKLGAYLIGGGGAGGNVSGGFGAGGGGGGGGGGVGFQEYTVTSGDTVAITIGSAAGTSNISVNASSIATANGGAVGSVGNGNQANDFPPGGAGGAAGSGSSNVAGAVTMTGGTGGAGGNGGWFQSQGGNVSGSNGGAQSTNAFTGGVTGLGAATFTPNTGGGGGGGGQGGASGRVKGIGGSNNNAVAGSGGYGAGGGAGAGGASNQSGSAGIAVIYIK